MNFLQSWMLLALPLALLPVIIHLLNRLRYRTVNWGAMMFLERAHKSATRMARVRQWLILLLRVLALAALILALARPLLGGWLGFSLAGPPDTVILLLDRSASMNARTPAGDTRLAQAVKTFTRSAEGFGSGPHFVLVDSATCRPSQVPAIGMLADMPAASATDTGANLPAMLSAALDYLADNKTGAAEIWIASDLQASSWQAGSPDWLALDARLKAMAYAPRIRLLAVNTPAPGDLALSLTDARTRVMDGKYQHELTFRIHQNSGETGEKNLTLFDGTNQHPVKVKVTGGTGRYRHRFETAASDQPVLGYLELPADANPGNNRAYFGVGKPPPRRALVVGNPTDLAAQISQLACTPGDDPAAEAQLVAPESLRPADLRDRALVVWSAPEPSAEIRQQVEDFVTAGGTLLLMPPARAAGAGQWGDWLVWGAAETAKADQPFQVAQWERADGPFADADSGDPLSLDQLRVERRAAFSGKGTPLGFYGDGSPFAMRFQSGGGAIIALSTSPDPAWSNLGMGEVAVPMMQRLMDEGAKRLAASRLAAVGTYQPAANAKDACLLPDPADRAGTGADPRTAAGVYQTEQGRLCLNRPESEDEPQVLALDAAATVMKDVSVHAFSDAAGDSRAAHSEIWKSLLLIMLALLAFETGLLIPANPSAKAKGAGL